MVGTTLVKKPLAELATAIERELAAAESDYNNALAHAIKAGEYLTQAKNACAHGTWLPWLAEHGWSRFTASKYMRLAESNVPAQAHLEKATITSALLSGVERADEIAQEAAAERQALAAEKAAELKDATKEETTLRKSIENIETSISENTALVDEAKSRKEESEKKKFITAKKRAEAEKTSNEKTLKATEKKREKLADEAKKLEKQATIAKEKFTEREKKSKKRAANTAKTNPKTQRHPNTIAGKEAAKIESVLLQALDIAATDEETDTAIKIAKKLWSKHHKSLKLEVFCVR